MTEPGGRRRVRRRKGDSGGDSGNDSGNNDSGNNNAPEPPVPGPPKPHAAPSPTSSAVPHKPGRTDRPASGSDKSERSLRGLVGAGPTQVSVSAAMRARDAARPSAEDIAAAERDLTIVRRHYDPEDKSGGQRRTRKPRKGGT